MKRWLMATLCLVVGGNLAPGEGRPRADIWDGLMSDTAAASLPDQTPKKLKELPFLVGAIKDAKTFASFAKQMDAHPVVRKQNGWRAIKEQPRWDRQVVIYAVLHLNTNSLKYSGYDEKNDVGTLTLTWSGIEPFYQKAHPAVLCRVSTRDIKKVRVVIEDMGTVAEIPVRD